MPSSRASIAESNDVLRRRRARLADHVNARTNAQFPCKGDGALGANAVQSSRLPDFNTNFAPQQPALAAPYQAQYVRRNR
jgi:hypothetical protein